MAEQEFELAQTRKGVWRDNTTGAANTEHTMSVTPAANTIRKLSFVAIKYSGAATHAGVRVELDSAAGAAYDTILYQGSNNAQDDAWIPANEVFICPGDALRVVAPAGGVGVTASITAVSREL